MVVANFTKNGKAGYSLPLKDGKPLFVSGEQETLLNFIAPWLWTSDILAFLQTRDLHTLKLEVLIILKQFEWQNWEKWAGQVCKFSHCFLFLPKSHIIRGETREMFHDKYICQKYIKKQPNIQLLMF